jgi:ABC-type sugar transport system ATPase subunit
MIRLENIEKCFGSTRALEHLNLTIEAAKKYVIVGDSGAGKTTLLRILAGLESSDRGEIFFNSQNITRLSAQKRGKLLLSALLTQDYAIYPHLTVEQNLHVAMGSLGLSSTEQQHRLRSALEWFDLFQLKARRPSQLSGGQIQRSALAKVMVRRPQLLMLDEPFSQLDPTLREQCRNLIIQMVNELSMTMVMVTHEPMDALRIPDHLIVMSQAKIVQQGDPQTLYRKPANRKVAELLSPLGLNCIKYRAFFEQQDHESHALFRPESVIVDQELTEPSPGDLCFNGRAIGSEFIGMSSLLLITVDEVHGRPVVSPATIRCLVSNGTPFPVGQIRCRVRNEDLFE